jgi:hypothetical protein
MTKMKQVNTNTDSINHKKLTAMFPEMNVQIYKDQLQPNQPFIMLMHSPISHASKTQNYYSRVRSPIL